MGGVINIITKKPTNTTSLNADLSIAEFGQKRISTSLKMPIIKNKLFGSISLLHDIRDGFYTNDFLNNSFDKQKQTGLNTQLKYYITQRWIAQLDLKYYNAKNDGAFPLVGDIKELLDKPYHLSQNLVGPMHDKTRNSSLVIKYKGNINQLL